jgi:hypothetical protein
MATSGGVISANELYTLDELKRRMGLEHRAWLSLKKKGLRFSKVGRKSFILGRHVIEILEKDAQSCHESKSSTLRAVSI